MTTTGIETLALETAALDHAKCIKQHALTVARNAKYHSNQEKANQFTAGNALLKEERTKTSFKTLFLL